MNAEETTPPEELDIVVLDPDDGVAYDPEEDPFEEDLADEGDLDFEPEDRDG